MDTSPRRSQISAIFRWIEVSSAVPCPTLSFPFLPSSRASYNNFAVSRTSHTTWKSSSFSSSCSSSSWSSWSSSSASPENDILAVDVRTSSSEAAFGAEARTCFGSAVSNGSSVIHTERRIAHGCATEDLAVLLRDLEQGFSVHE